MPSVRSPPSLRISVMTAVASSPIKPNTAVETPHRINAAHSIVIIVLMIKSLTFFLNHLSTPFFSLFDIISLNIAISLLQFSINKCFNFFIVLHCTEYRNLFCKSPSDCNDKPFSMITHFLILCHLTRISCLECASSPAPATAGLPERIARITVKALSTRFFLA